MKRLILFLFLGIMVFSSNDKTAAVENFLNNIKEKRIDLALEYVLNKEEIPTDINYNNETQELVFEALFKNMNYKILNVKNVGNNEAVVMVEIENIDMEEVFLVLFGNLMEKMSADDDNETDEGEMYDELKKIITSKYVPKNRMKTEFKVKKTEDGYKIDLDPENINTMFGNIGKLAENNE